MLIVITFAVAKVAPRISAQLEYQQR